MFNAVVTIVAVAILVEVKKGYCKVTRCKAAWLTTNPALFPINSQLNLF